MQVLLTTRLAVYSYSDVAPDSGVDNAAYTFAFYVYGRVDQKLETERFTGGQATSHRTATILARSDTPIADFSLVVDTSTGDQWRVTGLARRMLLLNVNQYLAEYAPQFTASASGLGP